MLFKHVKVEYLLETLSKMTLYLRMEIQKNIENTVKKKFDLFTGLI